MTERTKQEGTMKIALAALPPPANCCLISINLVVLVAVADTRDEQ